MEVQVIRELLRRGETGKALETLIGLLEKDSVYKDNLLRTLRVAEASYNAVRQQELKGILSFQEAQREYSRVTDTLLAVLDDFEAGKVPATAAVSTPGSRRMIYLAGGVFLLLVAVFAWWKLRDKPVGCPEFSRKDALHILIVPFDNLGGREAKPALLIQDNIQTLTAKANIPAEVKFSTREMTGDYSQNAEEIGRRCKADLVIYGKYKAFDKDSIRVKMGFRFLKGAGLAGSGPFMTFRDITEVQPTRDLQDAVFSLCAMIAVRDRNWQFAKRWMEKIKDKDEAESRMVAWLDKRLPGNN
ncbi:MAG: hypothetical protein L6Q97_14765 [Thermoanaerobaculia bacterium]|nr:hypothetical protein [Thermoanaerobaculia bacterium]